MKLFLATIALLGLTAAASADGIASIGISPFFQAQLVVPSPVQPAQSFWVDQVNPVYCHYWNGLAYVLVPCSAIPGYGTAVPMTPGGHWGGGFHGGYRRGGSVVAPGAVGHGGHHH